MGVNHRRFDVRVPQQLLDGSYVLTGFEQVRCEAVAEGVRGNAFLDICELSSLLDRALQCVSTYVVATENAGSGVRREAGRGEDELPDPLASSLVGIFAQAPAGDGPNRCHRSDPVRESALCVRVLLRAD